MCMISLSGKYTYYSCRMLHMSFMITSEYNNYFVIFVEYGISFHQYCDVKYYELNILGLKTTTLRYMLSSISIHIIMRMACCLISLTYIVEM